jgi:type IV pilus assembly protein PilM
MPIQKKNQLVGVDIGSHSIKLVEIEDSKKGRILRNFGIIGLPPDAIVEGSIKEMDVVSAALRDLYRNLKVKNKNVATSISGFSVIVKKITLSEKAEAELESTIQDEAEQYIPFDIDEVNLDFDILSAGIEPVKTDAGGEKADAKNMDVMLVAAKKDIIDDYVSLLQVSGLNPVVLDVDAFALENAFEMATIEEKGCCALVNLGAEELGINAVKNGISLFTRDSSYGGFQITEAIMTEFSVSYKEAEKIKLGGTKVEKGTDKLEEIFTSIVSEWVQEIKRALDFIASTYPDQSIEKIIVGGGSANLPGLFDLLKRETSLPVEQLNPFGNLIIDHKSFDPKYLKEIGPQAAVAVGLALRSIGDK